MIGLDLDGVVCDLLGAAKRAFGAPLYPQAYSFEEMYPHVSDEALFSFLMHRTTYVHIEPISDAVASIQELLHHGERIIYVTSRPEYLYRISVEWLKRNRIQAPLKIALSKEIAVQRLGISVFVDDNPDVLEKIECDTYLFSQPYNLCRASRAVRVGGWAELLGRLL